jgi:hypothetical protein
VKDGRQREAPDLGRERVGFLHFSGSDLGRVCGVRLETRRLSDDEIVVALS